ncbi:MAG: MoxR family ATPase [Syntrophomonadaceae bacterium]|nr:MoxR family ATPase [Syntrophomonadaceae bacterium]
MSFTMDQLRRGMETEGYICDDEIVVTVYLALQLEKPLLVCGAPGVGKTEIAKVLSRVFHTELIRLQCYEGLDENKALYEWNYQRQLLKIQSSRNNGEEDIFSSDYLLKRPLLKALLAEKRPVLLIDEIDKTDEEFEAFLFEVLSDFQVSIPELGTIRAKQTPIVILTSNGERELSDGLKRRCIFLYIDYPSVEKEVSIIRIKVPEASEVLAQQIATAVYYIRSNLDLNKKPAIAETLDWAKALLLLGTQRLTPEMIHKTLNVLLKDKEDQDHFKKQLGAVGLVKAVCE